MAAFAPCGICVEMYAVTSCSASGPPGTARMALPSIGATARRGLVIRARATCAAPARTSTSGPRSPAAMLPGTASNCSGAPGARASSMSTTAGSGM